MSTIQSNANHLLTIINDILDVSKIEARQMIVEAIETHPLQIVQEVAALIRPRAVGKGVQLHVVYDTPVPTRITSDPTRLRQILLNLAGNAIKFTEVGSVSIHMSCDPLSERLTLQVVDTGIGMTPEQREAIASFQAFNQADASTTRKFGGTGLGLRISSALAHLLGGHIEIESEEATGSTFTVFVNTGNLQGVEMLTPDQAHSHCTTAASKPNNQHHADPPVKPLHGLRILLAEDGLDNQRLIKHILTKAGATVTVCDNGLIAVETIAATSTESMPDLILMDMQMPKLDGYSATSRLRSQGYKLPIIALTAHAMDGDRQRCLDAGCDDYATKPVDRDRLIDTVAHYAAHPDKPKSDQVVSV